MVICSSRTVSQNDVSFTAVAMLHIFLNFLIFSGYIAEYLITNDRNPGSNWLNSKILKYLKKKSAPHFKPM